MTGEEDGMSEHTPGPWELWRDGSGAMQISVGDFVICNRNPVEHRARESDANARLIAAAPDMLEALRIDELLHTVGFNQLAARQISNEARTAYAIGGTLALRKLGDDKRRTAIAKAEGRKTG
jgi:hypothetical protein